MPERPRRGLHGAGLSEALRLEAGALPITALAAGALLVYAAPWAAARAASRAGAAAGARRARAWEIAAAGARVLLLPLFLAAVLRIAGGAPAVFLYGKF